MTGTFVDRVAGLGASSARVQTAVRAGRLEAAAVADATAIRMVAATTLTPVPPDPVEHLRAAHVTARALMADLARHDPAVEVPSTMTSSLFLRLTRKPTDPPRPPAPIRYYTFTPRKVLRRVLDHALDHLNQIDQWLAWQRHDVVPVPTDGWASAVMTLDEDRLPLTAADLDAWLWRIDQATRLLLQRAVALDARELDWQPPDGGWPLRRVLHHVARAEAGYAQSMEVRLPADAVARHAAATRHLTERLHDAIARGDDDRVLYVNAYGAVYTPDRALAEVLSVDDEILNEAA